LQICILSQLSSRVTLMEVSCPTTVWKLRRFIGRRGDRRQLALKWQAESPFPISPLKLVDAAPARNKIHTVCGAFFNITIAFMSHGLLRLSIARIDLIFHNVCAQRCVKLDWKKIQLQTELRLGYQCPKNLRKSTDHCMSRVVIRVRLCMT